MYAIADKYNVPLLKDLACEKFAAVLKDVQTTRQFNLIDFVDAIEIIYTSTLSSYRGLRDAILPTLLTFKDELRKNQGFVDLITSNLGEGDFALEVIDCWGIVGSTAEDAAEDQSWVWECCGHLRPNTMAVCPHCYHSFLDRYK